MKTNVACGVLTFCLIGLAVGAEYTTPVPILKQIDRHNDDGSYSYGYEGADGSFKIETKYPTGEVYGKYGYVDDTGKVREVEYGANKYGFQPAGSDINVAPPTLDPQGNNALADGAIDDGQYREDPSVYHKDPRYNNNQVQPTRKQQQNTHSFFETSWGSQQQAQPQSQGFQWEFEQPSTSKWNSQPAWNPPPTPAPQPIWNPPPTPAPQPIWNPPPTPAPQPVWNPPVNNYWNNNNNWNDNWNSNWNNQRYYQPQPQHQAQPYYYNPSQFVTHPAVKNIDYLSGSYSVSYGRR